MTTTPTGKSKRAGKMDFAVLCRVSKRRLIEREKYKELRRDFLRSNPKCEVCGQKSKDVHHRKGRGKYYLDVATWSAVCRDCHNRIHNNPAWAMSVGLMESRLSK